MQKLENLFVFLDTEQLGNMYFGKPEETPMKATLKIRNDNNVFQIDELRISVDVIDIKSKFNLFSEEYILTNLAVGETSSYELDFSNIQLYGTFDVIITAKMGDAETVSGTKIARIPLAERQDDFLAINTHVAFATDNRQDVELDLVKKVGCGWVMDDLLWVACEREKGKFEIPECYRNFANICKKEGLRTRFLLDARGPQLFYGEGSHPIQEEQIKHFARYCAEVAREFKGYGCAYEICSEWDHQTKQRKNQCINTPQAYARLLKASYEAIKAEDPDAFAMHAATGRMDLKFILGIQEEIGGGYTDALAIHPYPYHLFPISPAYVCTQTWMNILDHFDIYGKLSDMYFGGVPIWNTESGWSTCIEHDNGCTEILQAAYYLQFYLLSKCNKHMDKITFYMLADGGYNTRDYEQMLGLLGCSRKVKETDVPYLIKPAFGVLPVMANLLWDIEFERQIVLDDRLVVYQYHNSEGKYVTAFFTMEEICGDVVIGNNEFTDSDKAYDMFSNKVAPNVKDGKTSFFACDYPIMLFTDKPIENISFENLQNIKEISDAEYTFSIMPTE